MDVTTTYGFEEGVDETEDQVKWVVKIGTGLINAQIGKKVTEGAIELAGSTGKVLKAASVYPALGTAIGVVVDSNKYGWGGAIKKNLIDGVSEALVIGGVAVAATFLGAPAAVVAGLGVVGAVGLGILDVGFNIRVSRLFGF